MKKYINEVFGEHSLKEWIIALIEAPLFIAGFYIVYCLMYVVIGG